MTAPKKVTVVSDAPMALASDGKLLVNVTHLKDGDILEAARELLDAGHTLFVGIAVPARHRKRLARDVDDAAADMVGRLGALISARASFRSSAPPASVSRGRPASRVARPRGRRP
jgi:hypothetical protein